jgi:hypothetical protein
LVLAAWEGCRGLSEAQGQQLWQRLLFVTSYCTAVLVCTVLVKFAGSPDAIAKLGKVLSTVCAIQIIIVTQVLIYWRFHRKPESAKYIGPSFLDAPISTKTICSEKTNVIDNEAEQALAEQIQKILDQQNMYLQTNLKVADLARHLSVLKYRVRRSFRHHFNALNFNPFINEMRIRPVISHPVFELNPLIKLALNLDLLKTA